MCVCVFINSHMHFVANSQAQVWIGAWHDGTKWLWTSSGVNLVDGYFNGRPSFDPTAVVGVDRECMMMQKSSTDFGMIGGYICSYPRPFLCE